MLVAHRDLGINNLDNTLPPSWAASALLSM